MTRREAGTVWDDLKRLFGRQAPSPVDPTPGAARARAPARPGTAARALESAEGRSAELAFERRLAELLAGRPAEDAVVGGKVTLLDLGDLRARLGAKWPRYEERIHHAVNETLKRRLTEKDLFTRHGEDAYLVVFGESTEVEAKLKSALIAQEITKKFIGDADQGQGQLISVQTVVTTVDGRLARQNVDFVQSLDQALVKAEQVQVARRDRGQDDDAPLSPEEIQELLGLAERQIETLEGDLGDPKKRVVVAAQMRDVLRHLRDLEELLGAEDTSWVPLHRQAKPAAPAPIDWKGTSVEPVEVIRHFIDRADRHLAGPYAEASVLVQEAEDGEGSGLGLEFSYLPMWHAPRRGVWLYLCQATMNVEGVSLSGGALVAGELDVAVIDALDRLTLRRAKSALQEVTDEGALSVIKVPVHLSSLTRPSAREQYLCVCHAVPEDARRLLVWEVVQAPPGVWSTQLRPAATALQRLGRAVFLRLDGEPASFVQALRNLGQVVGAGIRVVGLDLGAVALSEAEAIERLGQLARRAAQCRLTCYAHGLDSPILADAAVRAGYEYLSGRAVAEPSDAPRGFLSRDVDSVKAS